MKRITSIIISAAVVASAAQAAVPKLPVEAIAPYVYPGNAPATPAAITFMPDGESYLQLSADGKSIVKYETASGKQLETVLDTTHTRENSVAKIEQFVLSPDGSKILLYTERHPVYRRSFKAQWYVFEIKRNTLKPLSAAHPLQQAPLFSPDATMVAFVADNNIYIKKLVYDSEVAVTECGAVNSIINGIPDWTYEEEFDTTCSMAWAPDNSTLCYLRYNEAAVPTFTFSQYEGWCNPQDQYALYPGRFSYKYPVAGEPNSTVSLHSYDIDTRKTKDIALADRKIEYIPRIAYGCGPEGADRLLVATLNRAQSRMELYSVNPKSTVVKSLLVEQAKAWLAPECYENFKCEDDGVAVLSERTGFSHVYKYSYAGQLIRQITDGNFDVTAYYGTDPAGLSYYQSVSQSVAAPQNALNRAVYRTDRTGKKTEALTPEEGWGSAAFSPALNYFVANHSSASKAPVYALCSAKGKQLRVLDDNAAANSRYASAPQKEFFTMQSEGTTLNGYIVRPADFTPSKRYPAIVWQYSGPGSQEVVNRWSIDWQRYAAMQGFVVVCVDPRGTAARGTAFRDVVYRRLGYFETIDQINVGRYVASLPYVDASRIGICGWSYGGYETLMAATDLDCPFAAAVAIAPVTDWRFYDTVYTERYLLTPQENPEGYDDGAPTRRAGRLACPLLIMSGTADDNVHLSNTMSFLSALQAENRFCDVYLFPGMNHSINGCNARAQVYARMIDYFARQMGR